MPNLVNVSGFISNALSNFTGNFVNAHVISDWTKKLEDFLELRQTERCDDPRFRQGNGILETNRPQCLLITI